MSAVKVEEESAIMQQKVNGKQHYLFISFNNESHINSRSKLYVYFNKAVYHITAWF